MRSVAEFVGWSRLRLYKTLTDAFLLYYLHSPLIQPLFAWVSFVSFPLFSVLASIEKSLFRSVQYRVWKPRSSASLMGK